METLSPLAGQTVAGSVSWSVSSVGTTSPTRVTFSVDGAQVGSDNSSPFGMALDSTKFADGSHTLTAVGSRKGYLSATTRVGVSFRNSAIAVPVATSPPTISGSAVEGALLSGSSGSWSGSPTSYGYQWQSCDSSGAACAAIANATSSTYLVAAADVGKTIRLQVTASNSAGSAGATSAATGAVAPAAVAPSETTPPSISGTPVVGETLTGSPGSWTGTMPMSYAYQWQRCSSTGCGSIPGATASGYSVQTADVGYQIEVLVTASNVAGSASGASSPTAAVTSGSATGPLPANPNAPRLLGAIVPWSPTWLSDVDAFSSLVGRVPSILEWYTNYSQAMLNPTWLSAVASRGITPLVTVEPWDGSCTTCASYNLASITAGTYDSWYAAGAQVAASYGQPLYLRFAPEMNGAWAPWEGSVNGNTAQGYVAAWRHVHAIFVAYGATNVSWVWAPNVFSSGGTAVDFTPYYPGSDVVDVLGLDGYNWGSLDVWQTWSQVFGSSYDTLCTLDATLPVMVTETASTELGGNKASWITSAYAQEIPARTPRVKAVVWFDENKETDWRVDSSSSSLAAYQAVATSNAWG